MAPTKNYSGRTVRAFLAMALLATACNGVTEPSPTQPTAASVTTTAAIATTQAPTAGNETFDADGAAALVQMMSEHWVAYVGSHVANGQADPDLGGQLADLYDSELATLDTTGLEACVTTAVSTLLTTVGSGTWEHSSWRDTGSQVLAADDGLKALWRISLIDNLVAGSHDGSVYTDVVVGPGGVVGILGPRPDPGEGSLDAHMQLLTCLAGATTVSADGVALLDEASRQAGLSTVLDANYSGRAIFSSDGADDGADDSADDSDDFEVVIRPGFPADPTDPEPIASTGSNKWDLITTDDPTAFACVDFLGRGPEEFLPASKEGGYQQVPDAFLYRAKFTDGTVIDMRVHPEIGSKADADSQLDHYLIPLGQLPTVLRRDIGRFAVRLGDNTATASQDEGMMLQSGNAAVRLADGRLEETLFHESVHTSLDPTYAYQRSKEWLDAQAADGRWLTEYGRENPDGEDLAETALYVYALLYHPDRLPPGMADEIGARIPNRVKFIEQSIFSPGQPLITDTNTTVTCDQ